MRLSEIRDSLPPDELLLAMQERSVWVRVGSVWEQQSEILPKEHPENRICVCALSDGVAVVGGGWGDKVSSMCHHFSVRTRRWRRLPDMPTARCGVSAAMLRNELLVFGGRDKHNQNLAVCEKFDMTDDVWSSAAPMIESLYRPLVAAARDKIYIVPQDYSIQTNIQQYDPTTDAFRVLAQLPQHLMDTSKDCLVAADEKLYLLRDPSVASLQYIPSTDQWTKLLSQPNTNYYRGCCGIVRDDKLLLCGGSRDGNDSNLVEEFDMRTQQWKTKDIKLPFRFQYCDSHVASIPY